MRSIFLVLLLIVCWPIFSGQAGETGGDLQHALLTEATALDHHVLQLALKAYASAISERAIKQPDILTVIDFSLPSASRRLWTFDLAKRKLLYWEWVAHGRDSGEGRAVRFSNDLNSIMSSLGAYVTDKTYIGKNGYSLRLRGLEKGFNDNIYPRAVVLHGAWYVSEKMIQLYGRLGRSYGCPAVRREISRQLIDTVKNGSMIFAYYPDNNWLAHSRLLNRATGSASLQ